MSGTQYMTAKLQMSSCFDIAEFHNTLSLALSNFLLLLPHKPKINKELQGGISQRLLRKTQNLKLPIDCV